MGETENHVPQPKEALEKGHKMGENIGSPVQIRRGLSTKGKLAKPATKKEGKATKRGGEFGVPF